MRPPPQPVNAETRLRTERAIAKRIVKLGLLWR
jgi:hypothetical protein